MAETQVQKEHFDILTKTGQKTGITKPRGDVHRDGDYRRAVHAWIFVESTQELLLQRRSDCKNLWHGLWDISSDGHIFAGDSSLISAQRELQEEVGVNLPKDAFELIFVFLQEWLRVHKNCFSNDVLIARIHGLGCGISPVLAIYLQGIHHLFQPSTNLEHHFAPLGEEIMSRICVNVGSSHTFDPFEFECHFKHYVTIIQLCYLMNDDELMIVDLILPVIGKDWLEI